MDFLCGHCGTSLEADPSAIGKKVRCPECRQLTKVKAPEIEFTCTHCGESLTVSEKMLGKRTRCAECGRMVMVREQAQRGPRLSAAELYLWAVFCPCVVLFKTDQGGLGAANLILWLTCCAAPFASGWAMFAAYQALEDQRARELADAMGGRQ